MGFDLCRHPPHEVVGQTTASGVDHNARWQACQVVGFA
jgi:hypothetical protein